MYKDDCTREIAMIKPLRRGQASFTPEIVPNATVALPCTICTLFPTRVFRSFDINVDKLETQLHKQVTKSHLYALPAELNDLY